MCGLTREFLFAKLEMLDYHYLFSFKISFLILCVKEVTVEGYWITVLFWCEVVVSYISFR